MTTLTIEKLKEEIEEKEKQLKSKWYIYDDMIRLKKEDELSIRLRQHKETAEEIFKEIEDKHQAKLIRYVRDTNEDYIDESIYIGDIVIRKEDFEELKKRMT